MPTEPPPPPSQSLLPPAPVKKELAVIAEARAFLEHLGQIGRMTGGAAVAMWKRPFELQSTLYQMDSLGVKSMGIASVTALFVGMVMAVQFAFGLQKFGGMEYTGRIIGLSFSRELAPKIRVNAVAPGPIPTENFIDSMKMHTKEREEELKEYIKLPLERWGTPEDIGAAVLYMVSPASSWVTGQCLYVTGGS